MNLLKEILVDVLKSETVEIVFPNLNKGLREAVEMKSYTVLRKIKDVLEEGSCDESCFMKIEKIMTAFESEGITIRNRHDF